MDCRIYSPQRFPDPAERVPSVPPAAVHRIWLRRWHLSCTGPQSAVPCTPCRRRLPALPPYPSPRHCPGNAAVDSRLSLECQMTGQTAAAGPALHRPELQTSTQSYVSHRDCNRGIQIAFSMLKSRDWVTHNSWISAENYLIGSKMSSTIILIYNNFFAQYYLQQHRQQLHVWSTCIFFHSLPL